MAAPELEFPSDTLLFEKRGPPPMHLRAAGGRKRPGLCRILPGGIDAIATENSGYRKLLSCQAALFSTHTLELLLALLDRYKLAVGLVALDPGGLSQEFAFELSALSNDPDAPIIADRFVACHFLLSAYCDVVEAP